MPDLKKEMADACDTGHPEKTTFTAPIVADPAAASKSFKNAQARAARLGHELHQVGTGFMMTRWTHSRHFKDLESVLAMLEQMEGRKS